MNHFTKKCTKENEYDSCFEKFVKPDEFAAVESCIKSSYKSPVDSLKGENTILEEHFRLRYQSGIIFYPGVSINNVAYRGNIEALEIKEAICATYTDKPEACEEKLISFEPNR